MEAESKTSEDAILGGRLRIRQPLRGHRVGHDAVLLAAATAARSGELAVDLGAGVGAAGLALAVRVPGLKLALVEIDAGLCALASDNARLNQLDDRVVVLVSDVGDVDALCAAGLSLGGADHVLMNPPFHDPRRQNVSPDPLRRLAHVATPELLMRWIGTAAQAFKAARYADAHMARRRTGRSPPRTGAGIRKYRGIAGSPAVRRAPDPRSGASSEGRPGRAGHLSRVDTQRWSRSADGCSRSRAALWRCTRYYRR